MAIVYRVMISVAFVCKFLYLQRANTFWFIKFFDHIVPRVQKFNMPTNKIKHISELKWNQMEILLFLPFCYWSFCGPAKLLKFWYKNVVN